MKLIVDGNNLLGALGLLGAREAQAEEFLQVLELAAAQQDWEAVVIFDGPERYQPRESGPLVVRYSQRKPADTWIERMVYNETDRIQTVVVTGDHALSNMVLGFGARVWSVDMLQQEMQSTF